MHGYFGDGDVSTSMASSRFPADTSSRHPPVNNMKEQIIAVAGSPHALEALYREQPKEFTQALPDVFAEQSDAIILQVWHERLFFQGGKDTQSPSSQWRSGDIWITVILSFIAGTLIKLPHFFPALDDDRFYSRNIGVIIISALIAYFCLQKSLWKKNTGIIIALLISGILYLNLLPDNPKSQTIVLSCLHMPFVFWSLLGIAFLGGVWKDLSGRMDYVRYNGELLIYSTIILIGGMVLTGLTLTLFGLINLHIEEWYMKNVVVYGAVASPIVATLLIDRIIGKRFKIAPLLAKVFTPLFLVTVIVYLLAMILEQKSPFTDRDFLVAFNELLLVVLGLCVFSISERGSKETAGVADAMNIMLASITLIINIVALAAILFRLTSYGFTPNRIAVLGANLLAFGHLKGILWYYIGFVRGKNTIDDLEQWIVIYLPAYTTWSCIVSVGFPLAFYFT
jgi:hypothetical protein